ncbi:MAG: Flp family type IVb pilin [Gammaproteobacteria bacterium]|nr:Flp family type IVb pilin [Gammaproteobacteria bacterium]
MRLLKEKMRRAAGWIRRFAADRRGVSTVEYALIVVAVIAIVGAVAATMGDAFDQLFTDLSTEMQDGLTEAQTTGGGTTTGGTTTGGTTTGGTTTGTTT